MQSTDQLVVVLGTGGTIAGTADSDSSSGYRAGVLSIEALVAAVPTLSRQRLECEQIAQIDSKDLGGAVWARLAEQAAHHLARPEVAGIVITHGTDTLEETAWFLQRLLAPRKPVVLTAAMRPATALDADGPQNLSDAVTVATWPGASGVVAVMAGRVHSSLDVRKQSSWRVDAFSSGEAGPLGHVRDGRYRLLREWPDSAALGLDVMPHGEARWPWVEIITSGALASGAVVRALVDGGVDGIVVAGTGNGTVHADLRDALVQAAMMGTAVLRCSRCATGGVVGEDDPMLPAEVDVLPCITPAQARVELMLRLLAARRSEGAGEA